MKEPVVQVNSLEQALQIFKKAIPKHLKKLQTDYDEKMRILKRKALAAKILLFLTMATTIFTLIFAAMFVQYGKTLIPISLFSILFLFWFEYLWLNSITEKMEVAKTKADPTITNQAMDFLKEDNILTHLKTLFREPSDDAHYQNDFLDLLVDLAKDCGWLNKQTNIIKQKKALLQEILEDAYSAHPLTFETEYLKIWRTTFEDLQVQLRHSFGNDEKTLLKKAEKKPLFFLDSFQNFLGSENGKKLRKFVHM